jgi:hypothetical protein
LKYIGPYLRMNTLSKENIKNQLMHFSRESLRHTILCSRCGITASSHDFKTKNIPNFDISILKKTYPLLCIYKKANPKLSSEHGDWDNSTFKKEVNITSNAYMTLSLLHNAEYYEQFKDIDSSLYSLGKLYTMLAKKQLDFYTANLRSLDGVFVDKKDSSDSVTGEIKFEEKSKKFKYSDQALLMCAFYKIGSIPDNSDSEAYKNFSLDIFNMFQSFREEIYSLSFEEINRLCFALNIFYDYSKVEEAKLMSIDLCDLLTEKYNEEISDNIDKNIENICMLYINSMLAYKNTSLAKFRESSSLIFDSIVSLYDDDKGIFTRDEDKKEFDFTCQEIVLYLISNLVEADNNPSRGEDLNIITNVFKHQLVNSGIVLSWPEAPNLGSAERYKDYSLKVEDLLDDHNFRMSTIPTPESCELAPVLTKSVKYSNKKEAFSQGKHTFDSTKTMPLLFVISYMLSLTE